jgi:hypothetical protein
MDPTKSLGETLADMGPVTAGIAVALAAAGTAVLGSLVPGLIRAGVAAAMSLPALISTAIAAVTSASAATLGIGAIAIAGGIAGVVASMSSAKSKMQDGVIGPGGEMVVSGPKGSIQLDKDDSIVAGTNLFDKNKETPPQSSTTSVNVDMSQTNALLQQLINIISAGGDIVIDGQKVGQALNLVAYKTQ